MKSIVTIKYRARVARSIIKSPNTTLRQQSHGLWDYITSLASGLHDLLFGGIGTLAKAIGAHASVLKWLIPIQLRAIYGLAAWIVNDVERKIYNALIVAVDRLRAWIFHQLQVVYYILAVAINTLRKQLLARISAEVQARKRAIARAEAQARNEIRALHLAIEREAAQAYNGERTGHLSAVSVLGDAIAESEPAVRFLVGRIIRYAIDLAEIDNPAVRILVGFLLSRLINRLGIEKVAGSLLSGMVLPSGKQGKPRGLPEVVTLICARLNVLEQFSATFMADGGPEILQAGEQWRDETSVSTSIALAAFFGTMVAAPNQWATAVDDTIGIVVSDTISAVADIMGRI